MKSPDRYGVIGYPISHSRSPLIHRVFAEQTGEAIEYEPLKVRPDKLERAVRQFQRAGGKGLNVTAPHKSEVIKLCDHLSERAATAGAVNTLSFRDHEIHGDNTDGIGLLRDLAVNHDLTLENMRMLILGAGGATRGIIGPLLEMRPALLIIANRTLGKAKALTQHFSGFGPVSACRLDEVPDDTDYELVINATSAGLKGDTPSYPAAAVSPETICYDLSYGLSPTPFSIWAREQGAAESIMGWGMLVEQAAESFNIWRGVRPQTAPVLEHMLITV
ncbi:MAG: shikimate dehydrogenase [Gammaproteobacteria bacterium]|nr:shikimate dehydrogenase [Gammaproteobacteria bacterium]NNF50555.1 shikimate dehydrogenase [Woeseiaceae bacterium]MBT8093354.1 shikimate dehydrogenase [Gammaproteobacteria bacterium]MBT8104391.1 shikimate dehydrogenase [Gammaproteobacteria bacterium]NNK24407.1 shikimate dehydrogenase [Woeseiaceae bacterium]